MPWGLGTGPWGIASGALGWALGAWPWGLGLGALLSGPLGLGLEGWAFGGWAFGGWAFGGCAFGGWAFGGCAFGGWDSAGPAVVVALLAARRGRRGWQTAGQRDQLAARPRAGADGQQCSIQLCYLTFQNLVLQKTLANPVVIIYVSRAFWRSRFWEIR